jgi:hypothetical protein
MHPMVLKIRTDRHGEAMSSLISFFLFNVIIIIIIIIIIILL